MLCYSQVVEELSVKSDVAAVAMEEAAPVAVSRATMQTPKEVFEAGADNGMPRAEGELSRLGGKGGGKGGALGVSWAGLLSDVNGGVGAWVGGWGRGVVLAPFSGVFSACGVRFSASIPGPQPPSSCSDELAEGCPWYQGAGCWSAPLPCPRRRSM